MSLQLWNYLQEKKVSVFPMSYKTITHSIWPTLRNKHWENDSFSTLSELDLVSFTIFKKSTDRREQSPWVSSGNMRKVENRYCSSTACLLLPRLTAKGLPLTIPVSPQPPSPFHPFSVCHTVSCWVLWNPSPGSLEVTNSLLSHAPFLVDLHMALMLGLNNSQKKKQTTLKVIAIKQDCL